MQKYFTKELTQPLKVIFLGLVLGLGISFAMADWTAPTLPAPTCPTGNPGCDAPINTSAMMQIKKNANATISFLPSGTNALEVGNGTGTDVKLVDGSSGITDQGNVSMLGNLSVGLAGFDLPLTSKFYTPVTLMPTSSSGAPLTIDLSAYNTGPAGRNAFSLIGSSDNDNVGIIQNKSKFFFYNYGTGSDTGPVTVQAGKVQLDDTTQGAGKILVSSDNTGLSTWGTISIPTPVPDIKMMEEDWADENDNWHGSIFCPADYAAVSVSCTSSKEDGVDDCHLVNAQDGFDVGHGTPNDTGMIENWAAYGHSDYAGGMVSPANNNANVHIWLTCMRYQNFPPLAATVNYTPSGSGSTGGTTGGGTYTPSWHYAPGPTNASNISCSSGAFPATIGGHGVTNWGYVSAGDDAPTQAGPFSVNMPATPTNVHTGFCVINTTLPGNIHWSTMGHLPTNSLWVYGTSAITQNPADNTWSKTEYRTVLYY